MEPAAPRSVLGRGGHTGAIMKMKFLAVAAFAVAALPYAAYAQGTVRGAEEGAAAGGRAAGPAGGGGGGGPGAAAPAGAGPPRRRGTPAGCRVGVTQTPPPVPLHREP